MKKITIAPPNCKTHGIKKLPEGWVCVSITTDSAGKIESVETTEPANRMTAIENVKIKMARQFFEDDGA